ncbi:interleukin-17 receptor A [Pelobates fuscus]|uniref:interleukin-17 receptor A n=1 Tax=Pelobates fuscus TaxID=191477 RepID=UPI002FE49955
MAGGLAGKLAVVLLLCQSGIITSSNGLRVIPLDNTDCSQEGIQCTVMESSCMDISWIKPFNWTPSAPERIDVNPGVRKNELGHRVPVLEIKWTLAKDSSILDLQGVELSVLQHSTNQQTCVQFHFGNQFPSQVSPRGEAWQFVFNNFEVERSQTYDVTVQNLPRQNNANSKEQSIYITECIGEGLGLTDICCKSGYCWKPNISVEIIGNDLVMNFDPLEEAEFYSLLVINNHVPRYNKNLIIPQGAKGLRQNQTIYPAQISPACWYDFQIWPHMSTCQNDCLRLNFKSECTLPSPKPVKRMYMSCIAAPVTLLFFGCVLLLCCLCGNITPPPSPPPTPPPPLPHIKKVWLIYSADHTRYVNVVIKFADFLRGAWGMEVIVDRLHEGEIAEEGHMTWLCHQKKKIEDSDGSILVLCSRGTREKWNARLTTDKQRITLRKDRELQDLFTPAITIISADFQNGLHNEQYIIAYFEELSDLQDIPSLFNSCLKYNLVRDLQDIFFRIQRKERHCPRSQYDVPQEGAKGYENLRKALKRCQAWQEKHLNWFNEECLPNLAKEDESETEQEEGSDTIRFRPLLCDDEPCISKITPTINDADVSMKVEPVTVTGPPSIHVELNLSEGRSSLQTLQPITASEVVSTYIQEPCLEIYVEDPGQFVSQDSFVELDQTSSIDVEAAALRFLQLSQPGIVEQYMSLHKPSKESQDEGYATWNNRMEHHSVQDG